MRKLATIFVTVLTLTACQNNSDADNSANDAYRVAVGVSSKMGKSITAKELCSDIKTDGITGKITLNAIRFNANSTFVKRQLAIDSQVQFVVEGTSRGYWGILSETLMLNENGKQSRVEIKETDGGQGKICYQIGSGEAASTYCPCNPQ